MTLLVTKAGRQSAAPAIPSTAGARLRQTLARKLRAAWRRMLRASADRRAEAELCALSDRALKDIGLNRTEISSLVHKSANDLGRIRQRAR